MLQSAPLGVLCVGALVFWITHQPNAAIRTPLGVALFIRHEACQLSRSRCLVMHSADAECYHRSNHKRTEVTILKQFVTPISGGQRMARGVDAEESVAASFARSAKVAREPRDCFMNLLQWRLGWSDVAP